MIKDALSSLTALVGWSIRKLDVIENVQLSIDLSSVMIVFLEVKFHLLD